MEKNFDVNLPRDDAVEIITRDETLLSLFPEGETELVARG